MPLNSFGIPIPIVPTPMLREARSSGGSASQSHAVSDHHVHQNISRPGPFGQNARGDGQHNNNLGSRRDHEQRNYDWNSSPIFNARGIYA
ncbi:hypothetical protein Nepgr_024720 [Nepenthes gracilis]|uniref:Uncharacterized protein n=1 Tax=Nepenthes gracilis TaxID=150966 RepID=A0AAD3T6G7_NEPGR|nr:hypothetical protein Nepgr_024720 [Nepenthes gracilis]